MGRLGSDHAGLRQAGEAGESLDQLLLSSRAGVGGFVGEVVAEIEPHTIAALREDEEMRAPLGADHLRVLWPVRHALDQHAAEEVVWRIGVNGEAQLLAHA